MASARVLKSQDSVSPMASTPSLKPNQRHQANGTKFPDALSYTFCLVFDVRLSVFSGSPQLTTSPYGNPSVVHVTNQ